MLIALVARLALPPEVDAVFAGFMTPFTGLVRSNGTGPRKPRAWAQTRATWGSQSERADGGSVDQAGFVHATQEDGSGAVSHSNQECVCVYTWHREQISRDHRTNTSADELTTGTSIAAPSTRREEDIALLSGEEGSDSLSELR